MFLLSDKSLHLFPLFLRPLYMVGVLVAHYFNEGPLKVFPAPCVSLYLVPEFAASSVDPGLAL